MRKTLVGIGLLGVMGFSTVFTAEPQDPARNETRGEERGHGSLLVQVTFEPDGAAGEGVCAQVVPLNGRDEVLEERFFTTDAKGLVHVERIEAGRVRVTLDRGPSCDADVAPGRQTVVKLSVPPGTDVRGLVVDSAGQPVAGAEIWAHASSKSLFRRLHSGHVATSDPRGRFRLRAVAGDQSLSARCRSHAPSTTWDLESDPITGDARVRLQLTGPGCSLAGSVVGEGGWPLRALVLFVPQDAPRDPAHREGGPWMATWCDHKGRFEAHGLLPGEATLVIAAHGHAPREVEVDLAPGPMPDLEVRLERGASLSGTVTNANGIPVADAHVSVTGGPRIAKTRTRADGRWFLDSLPTTEVGARVSAATFLTQERTFAAPGHTSLAWRVLLEPRPRIKGRVVDEAGRGLPKFTVEMRDTEGWTSCDGTTDAEGSFDIVVPTVPVDGGQEPRFSFAVREPGQPIALAIHEPAPVAAGADDIQLQVLDWSRATCWIEATVQDPDGAPIRAAFLRLSQTRTPDGPMILEMGSATSGESSSLRAGAFPPGCYKLELIVPSLFARMPLTRRTLRPGEVLQLGTVRVEARGRFAFAFRRKDGVPLGALSAHARSTTDEVYLFLTPGDPQWGERTLAPGEYGLEVSGETFRTHSTRFTVAAGTETSVDLELEPAVTRLIEFPARSPEGWPESGKASWVVKDPEGREVARRESEIVPDASIRASLLFGAGTYSVHVTTDTGRRYVGTFQIPNLTPSYDAILVQLDRVP